MSFHYFVNATLSRHIASAKETYVHFEDQVFHHAAFVPLPYILHPGTEYGFVIKTFEFYSWFQCSRSLLQASRLRQCSRVRV